MHFPKACRASITVNNIAKETKPGNYTDITGPYLCVGKIHPRGTSIKAGSSNLGLQTISGCGDKGHPLCKNIKSRKSGLFANLDISDMLGKFIYDAL